MTSARFFTAAGAVALLAPTAFGQFSFQGAVSVAAGTQPSGIAAADFDGDGDIDLATTADGPDRVVVLLNDGAGNYAAGPGGFLPNSSSPQDLEAGDFDGDGDVDLAVAVRDPQGAVIIMTNGGGAGFSIGMTVFVGDRPRGLSVGDHDGDGDLDIAVANRDSNSASVLTNNGMGSFAVATVAVGGETRDTAFGDFDGDTDLDLAVTDHDNRTVDTFINNGGVFSASTSLSVGPFVRPDGVESADLDGDGDADLAVAVSDQTLGINQAMVYLNSAGVFSGPFAYDTAGTNTSTVAAADLDCDGMLDLLLTNADSNNVSLLQNIGAGVFGMPSLLAVGSDPSDAIGADIDGDGDADIACANRNTNDVSILVNDTCQPCAADLDGDGVVGIQDLLVLLAAWGPNPGHVADLDGDGIVGITDLITLLAAWGACP